jgi:hypothetical protein
LDVLADWMAYSGEFDAAKLLAEADVEKNYAAVVTTTDGEEVPILDGIRDIGEAFFWKGVLQQACDSG